MLSGRRKKDYAVESAADALAAQAEAMGVAGGTADFSTPADLEATPELEDAVA